MFKWVVIGQTAKFLLAINITSELFFTSHFLAKYSVTPFLLRSSLSIGQLMNPEILLFKQFFKGYLHIFWVN